MTVKQIRHLEDNVYKLSSRLKGALEILGSKVSEILGYEVVADICNGEEIEFRKFSEDGYVDDFSCIRIEDVIEKLSNVERNGKNCKKPASKDLEKEIIRYVGYPKEVDEDISTSLVRKAAHHFANWQKEQMMKDAEIFEFFEHNRK